MRTPSLHRRVLTSGLGVFLLVVIALETFVFLSLRGQLEDTLEEVLAARVSVVEEVSRDVHGADLADQLAALGIPAVISTADGQTTEAAPAVPRFGSGPPGPLPATTAPRIAEVITLPDGGEVEVFASRAGVDATMRRVVALMAMGTLAAVLLAGLLLRRATATAIAPLDDVVVAAGHTAEGRTGQRLRPDDPSTELGRMATAYDEMLDALESALERARSAEERTRRFFDDAAHQLRTPIAGIRASVELLLTDPEPHNEQRVMANLVRETARASRLLRDLLTMARLDAGQVPASEPTDLAALCRDELERTASLAPDLSLSCRVAEHAPLVAVDARALRELIANLLDNARRHAEAGVEVRLEHTGTDVEVEVRDDGPGVPAEVRQRMFERFASLDGAGGSGLGLPIARSIAEAHDGTLVYRNGAFLIRLPVRAPHA